MHIDHLQLFKVVEFDQGILILGAANRMMNRPGAVELIIADAQVCGQYMERYLGYRSKGHSIRDAHRRALEGANIVHQLHGQMNADGTVKTH